MRPLLMINQGALCFDSGKEALMLKQARKFFQEYVDGWRRFGNVTQERRLAGDNEHLPLIRGARRPHQLPNTYHDIESHRGDDIFWKNRSKVRHA